MFWTNAFILLRYFEIADFDTLVYGMPDFWGTLNNY